MVEVIEIDKLQCSWILYKYHAVIHKFSGTYKQLSTSHGKNQLISMITQSYMKDYWTFKFKKLVKI